MSDDEQPRKRARRADRLKSAASLQTRSPFDNATFAQPAVEQTLLNLSFDDAVAFCSSTPRVHAICSQVSFWREWLQRRPLRTNEWRLRSDQDASLDQALLHATNKNESTTLSPRAFMYLLKIVQTLRTSVLKSVLSDIGLELLRQSRITAHDNVPARCDLERKWRHYVDALRAVGLPLFALTSENVLGTMVAARHLSEPIVRALFALPDAYADDGLTPPDLERKKEALNQLAFNTTLTVLNESGYENEMTPLEAAVALGDARLVRLLLRAVLDEYERIERAPDTAPYRRDRVRQLKRNAVDQLYTWARPDDIDDESEQSDGAYENALTEQQLDAIVEDVFPQYFAN